jgi:uncharacterized protein YdaT
MAWTRRRYPEAMRNLPANVRARAIELANERVGAGEDEAKAIRAAIVEAKREMGRARRKSSARPGKTPRGSRRRRTPQRGRPERRASAASRWL